ncbi:sporulation protein, YlmC/YmxH family [Clostridium cavendishii DSM 21758]|uniref:Sporulation protein, YlmC/YmxH family n=1 Tax=Clostridium cavendishii DSM 21758 TaxID=1121302 RepID=A0A1M6KD87_9CLOT|nr:YlmC/YmxH family sporulation protein [Clostridium cavendishii]SHJ56817.1 sporulation protein, YlmC/YmxH family [Clostridium cavendishii DSM 21758]
MELMMYSVNNLKTMEVIDINLGSKLGFVRDIKFDCDENRIVSLIVPVQAQSWFGKMDMLEIMWDEVYKIGVDVILVKTEAKIHEEV